jgi:hypothetical protein
VWPALATAIVATLVALPAGAQTLQHTYRFDRASLQLHAAEGASTLSASKLPRTWERGRPEIPYDIVTFLVPAGTRVASVRAVRRNERVFLAGTPLQEASTRFTDTGDAVAPPEPRHAVKAVLSYPALAAEPAGSGALAGYQLASVRVYPVRRLEDRILVAEEIELEVELRHNASTALERKRFSADIESSAARQLRRLVVNPDAIDSYTRRVGQLVEPDRRGFHPSNAPSLEGSPVEYVIITNDALAASFQVLADWKTQRGVPTVVRTVEWISSHYRNGSDLQETIRTFIQDAYAKWAVRWVLLGGDTNVLPARYAFSEFGPVTDEEIPADIYFACLDGNWNADGDALWGEAALDAMTLVDDVDLYAEVFVSRLPVSTLAEADLVIGKVVQYENPAQTTYQNNLLFLSEVLFPVDWEAPNPVNLDGAEYSDMYLWPLVSPGVNVARLYERSDPPWSGALPLTLQDALAAMNNDPGFVNHIGHGFRYNMSCGDRSLVNSDVAALGNVDQHFILYMLNCTATAFDFPCLAEAFLKDDAGAVAVLGASRAAFAIPSRNYNIGFFEALYDATVPNNLGELFVESRLAHTGNALLDTSDHYTHFLYNVLADPEMIVHTSALGSTAVTIPSSIDLGSNDVLVAVSVDGVPKEDALVCLQKGEEEYVYGRTDVAGNVTLQLVAESAGSVVVTVSGLNMTTVTDSISVDTSGTAYPHVTSLTLDDAQGNGDGVLDAGETLDVDATFRNDGASSASGINGILRTSSPWITVLDSVYTLGTMGSGATAPASGSLSFLVNSATPDGSVLVLEFETTDGNNTWTDTVSRIVHAPDMQLTRLEINDPNPGGNGDGVIQAGETFDIDVWFKNYGTGRADGLQASILVLDPDIIGITTSTTIGGALSMQETTGSPPFRLTEATIDENIMNLTLTDTYGRMRVWPITLRGPAQPATPELDASEAADIVAVSWIPSLDADLAGYHVYRMDALNDWQRITIDRTSGVAYYRDTGLSPATEYFYQVTSVDSSGNESAFSPVASVITSPAQLPGWPITMRAPTSCPPAVGDITGDGSNEIVAGDSALYAWDWSGLELRDDDLDPQSWGVFVNEIGTVTAAVVVAEITSDPGLEVFVTVWGDGSDANTALVVLGDGTIAPGWPQNPDSLSAQRGYWASPAAVDVDGDGLAELFAPAKNGNLYAWHGDGSPLGASAAFKSNLGTWTRCSPAFANLDGDPEPEIVYLAPTGTLHAWNASGSNVPHFPLALGTLCFSSPAIGDVDNDGKLDIVALTEDDSLYVIDSSSGKRLPGWPVWVESNSDPIAPSPALADFDFDAQLEIVLAHNASTQNSMRVYDSQGSLLPGWPQPLAEDSESSPIVADFSGDGVPDIVFGNEGGSIHGWDKDGNVLPGFPLPVGDFVRATPFATDCDGDGDIDLVSAGWDRTLRVWDFTAAYDDAAAQWPTFKHDAQRSGYSGHTERNPSDAGGGPQEGTSATIPPSAFLGQNMPNPFNPMTRIEYGVPRVGTPGPVPVQINIYDVKGRHVRRLVHGTQEPGVYTTLWDGRDDRGTAVHSGVFFYRLQAGSTTRTRKMVLLR